jgi:C_GCAxxG_C_C family probable redox protein
MESRKTIAIEKKRQCNCACAVLSTYCDLVGLDEETARNLTYGFGSGMGTMEGTCGAIVGAGMVLGLANKKNAGANMRQVLTRFKERNGAIQCRQLKGIDTGKPLRACNDCVADACEFLEECLTEE